MADEEHPRLLFVTPHAFNHVTGGGVAFSNLFRGWPQDCLATAHNDAQPPSGDICRRYYALGPAELDLVEPFASLRRGVRARMTSSPGFAGDAGVAAKSSALGTAKRLAVGLLGEGLPERARLTPALERWIEGFEPQVLYSILGTNGMMSLIEAVRERFNLPLVVHIMDDWPATAYRHGLLGKGERRRMERHLERFFGVAAECLAISPAMAAAYGARYGRPFRDFQNAIDVARWSGFTKSDLATGRPAELLYVGSIFPNAQLDSLVDCAEAVATLSRTGYPIKFSIAATPGHGEQYRERLAIDPAIRIEDAILDDATFFRRIASADALLIPVNFDSESIRFIRYSMPAKLPAYMASGTPILVYGPAETAQVQYARDAGWGHIVGRRDPAALAAALRTIMSDETLRVRLHRAAQSTAAQNHDAPIVRAAFQGVLADAARVRASSARPGARLERTTT